MNNTQISNQKTKVPTGLSLNDKDYITTLLTSLKEMEKNFSISMTESGIITSSIFLKYLFRSSGFIFLTAETSTDSSNSQINP